MAIWAEIKKAINSDFSKPLNELIDDGFSKGTVKSVQRGTVNLDSTKNTVTISTVNTNKAFVNISWTVVSAASNFAYPGSLNVRVSLTNSTTLTFERYNATLGLQVNYEVIEFY